MDSEERYPLQDKTHQIIGAAMKVHTELGCGFLEAVYQEALAIAFEKFRIPFESQKPINIHFWNQTLKKSYIADFLCYQKIIVEIKAQNALTGTDEAQLINYLKATGCKVGLLLNFGTTSLEVKRRSL